MLVLIVETNKKSDTSAARPIKCDDTKEKSIKIDILSAKKMGAAILAAILFNKINLFIKWSVVVDVRCLYLLLNLMKKLQYLFPNECTFRDNSL